MLAFAIQHFASRLSSSAVFWAVCGPVFRAVFGAVKGMLAVAVLAALSGCATTAIPVGDWSRLSDLDLSDRSLDHLRVAVECGSFDRNGRVQQHKYRLCRSVKPWLQSLGAEMIEPSSSPAAATKHADFTLEYVEGGIVDQQSSAISLLGSVLTGFLLPYVTSSASESELRVLDSRGVEVDRQKMRIQEIRILGWGALYAMVAHRDRQDEKDLSERFYKFAQNRLVSQAPGRDL